MKEDVLLQLALAKQYAHHARFAGTPRQAVSDGYSAVDAILSALLVHSGQEPPRNHKLKLETAQKGFPTAFAAEVIHSDHGSSYSPGADWASLEEFYKQWLASRYEEFDMDPGVASSRVREANAAVSAGIRFLAKAERIDADALDEAASVRAFGYQYSETSNAVGDVHDLLFDQAERYGEEHGSRLRTTLSNRFTMRGLPCTCAACASSGAMRSAISSARRRSASSFSPTLSNASSIANGWSCIQDRLK
ncbi:hypothetical protein [Bradyrhizobium sp. B120]|uniref:hypothetical protein n=1 Tax=Bradyrhizobium sp. B120 TaxID=3410088 RepID=UPI003B9805EF